MANFPIENSKLQEPTTSDPLAGLSVRDRMAKAALNASERLLILMDNSGSMAEAITDQTSATSSLRGGKITKIDAAKKAIEGFLSKCDKRVSAVGLITFESEVHIKAEPVQYYQNVLWAAQQMHPAGGTNLAAALKVALKIEKVTRLIVVSDGEASDQASCLSWADQFKSREVPVDCVFIGNPDGSSTYSGEFGSQLLKQIAELTGGFYFTVSDFASFEKTLNQLEASARLMLEHK